VLRRWSARGSLLLLVLGLFTVSWERFGNVPLGPYNVKLSSAILTLSALLAVPLAPRLRSIARSRSTLALGAAFGVLPAYLIVRAFFASDLKAALPQIAALVTGALAPALAVLLLCTSVRAVQIAARWFVLGAAAASLFGLYQLLAFYTGLPQGIEYRGVGTDGIVGRISALSYEPAYFAYFLVLALGLTVTLDFFERRRAHLVLIALFTLTLALANVRALVFVTPLLLILLALRARRYQRTFVTVAVAALVGIVLSLAMPSIVTGVQAAQTASASGTSAPVSEKTPPTSGRADERPAASPSAAASIRPSDPSLLDPDEPSSNAPRLSVYRTVLQVALRHVVFGSGLGNLQSELQTVTPPPPNIDLTKPVVANNIWLQALVDGGVIAAFLQLGAIVLAALVLFRRWTAPLYPAAVAWLSVIAVGGMLTSYFYDIKIWVVGALILAALSALRQDSEARRT
jgi:hypothetical protein